MNKEELTLYTQLLTDIKERVRQSQHRALLSANAEMIVMNWDIGRMIDSRQKTEGWGTGVIPRLANDLKNVLPELKGFSERNIKRMLRFFREYPFLQQAAAIVPQPAALLTQAGIDRSKLVPQAAALLNSHDFPGESSEQRSVTQLAPSPSVLLGIPWFHHVVLFEKIKDIPTRMWYARQTMEQGWSRDVLTAQIKSQAHHRQGAAITNFGDKLPVMHAQLATGLLKDPFIFDFLTLEEPFHERELEAGLLTHIEKFLLELGRGFAFVGRQYELTVSDRDFYLDLLFYHLQLRCFVVVDLKKGEFKPEYAGKMNFYCSAVDAQMRHPHDAPTIGLILCQTKDRIIAEYALRDIEKPIGVADYELTRALPETLASSLPSIEDIEAELSHELQNGVETIRNE
jgi:predicted nuclease of restriction endonuclease-like (RecB) superfamily